MKQSLFEREEPGLALGRVHLDAVLATLSVRRRGCRHQKKKKNAFFIGFLAKLFQRRRHRCSGACLTGSGLD